MTQPECVVLIGLQAAGKTSFYRERFASTHRHISKDNFPNARNREQRQAALLEASLGAGDSVVVDNTNATPAGRKELIAIAHRLGARVVGYCFESSRQASLGRNRRREGRARVPDVAILATAKRFVKPSPDEGFDELHSVRLTDTGTFEVLPYVAP